MEVYEGTVWVMGNLYPVLSLWLDLYKAESSKSSHYIVFIFQKCFRYY